MMKEEVIKQIISHQEKLVKELNKAVEDLHSGADLDEEDTMDPEDFSHQTESGDMMLRLKQQSTEAENDLEIISSLSDNVCDHVQLGAYVRTDQMNFLVAIPTKPFDFDNNKTVGISIDAPIYKAMLNKKSGDSFSFRDINYNILAVS